MLATLVAGTLLAWAIWTTSVACQRLFFSPLSKIPGPKLAVLTHWYEFYYDVVKPGQYVFKIQELHKQYGPIIRITPREIHIKDVDFLENIYPTSNLRKREKDMFALRNLGFPYATAGSRDHDLHRRRREALNSFFSQKEVLKLEPLVKRKIAQVCSYLDANKEESPQAPLNLYDLYYALARDVVFQCNFDRDCNELGNLEEAAIMRQNLTRMLLAVKLKANLNAIFRWLDRLTSFLAKFITPAGVKNMGDLRKNIGFEIGQVMKDRNEPQKPHKRSILYDLRDHSDLQKPQELPIRLGQEGTFLVMAGTESTAKSLGIAHFYILHHPRIMERLREELKPLPTDATISTLEQLPYLSAIVNEANRLAFGLTGRNARVAPGETLRYRQYHIPAGTPMSMTTLSIHTDETIFPDPWSFKPERWLGEEGKTRQRYQYGFGRGARRCLGMNLANAELCATLAAVARYDMQLFETDLSDVEFRHDYQVAHPKLNSKGIRVKVQGKPM